MSINSPANAVLGVASAAIFSIKKPSVSVDSVSGVCFYRGGSCNGAEIILLKNEEREIFRTSFTFGAFQQMIYLSNGSSVSLVQ